MQDTDAIAPSAIALFETLVKRSASSGEIYQTERLVLVAEQTPIVVGGHVQPLHGIVDGLIRIAASKGRINGPYLMAVLRNCAVEGRIPGDFAYKAAISMDYCKAVIGAIFAGWISRVRAPSGREAELTKATKFNDKGLWVTEKLVVPTGTVVEVMR